MTTSAKGLNDIQLTLLKLFNRQMSENEQSEIKEILLNYYDNSLQKEIKRVINEKGYTNQDFEEVLNKKQRTKE